MSHTSTAPPHSQILQLALSHDESNNEAHAYKLYMQYVGVSAAGRQEGDIEGYWQREVQWCQESIEILQRMQHIALKQSRREQQNVQLESMAHDTQQRNPMTSSPMSPNLVSSNVSDTRHSLQKDFTRFSSLLDEEEPSHVKPATDVVTPPLQPFSARKPPPEKLAKSNPLKYFRELAEYQEIQKMEQQKHLERQKQEQDRLVREYKRTWRSAVKESSLFQWDYTNPNSSSSLSTSSYGKSSLFYKQRPQRLTTNQQVSWQEFVQEKFCAAYERMDNELLMNDYRFLLEVRQMEQDLLLLEKTIADLRSVSSSGSRSTVRGSTYSLLGQDDPAEFAPALDERVQEQLNAIGEHIENYLNSIVYRSEHALNHVISDFTQKFLIMRTPELDKDSSDDDDSPQRRKIDPYYCEIMINEGKSDIMEFLEKLIYVLYAQYWGGMSSKQRTHILELAERKSFEYVCNCLFRMGVYKRLLEYYHHLDETEKKNTRLNAKLEKFRRKQATLKHLATPFNFQLSELKEPYKKCIEMISYFTDFPTVKGKLTVLKECLHQIPKETAEYWKQRGKTDEPVMNADDLIPVFCYLVIWSGMENLFSHLQFISDFVDERELLSESGYALTTFESVCDYLSNLEWDTMQMEYHRMLQDDEQSGRSTVNDMIVFEEETIVLTTSQPTGGDTALESFNAAVEEHISEAEVSDALADLDESIDEGDLDEFL